MKNPAWLDKALSYIGLTEIKGIKHNPEIVSFWKTIKLGGIKDDETPWCAAFVGAVLEQCGFKSTRNENARSYTKWDFGLNAPALGCVVVFWRDNPKGAFGHVGFVVGRDQNDNLMVVGGNQGDAVNIKPFSVKRVLEYRWPLGAPLPDRMGFTYLPLIDSDGKVSSNEA